MMDRTDWKTAIDDLMAALNATGDGATLYRLVSDHHSRPYNKKLNFYLVCGGCTAKIYFAISRLSSHHFSALSPPPSATCSKCGHAGDHEYQGLAHSA